MGSPRTGISVFAPAIRVWFTDGQLVERRHGPARLHEAVDSALHGVTLLIDVRAEGRWSAALGPLGQPVGVLSALLGMVAAMPRRRW